MPISYYTASTTRTIPHMAYIRIYIYTHTHTHTHTHTERSCAGSRTACNKLVIIPIDIHFISYYIWLEGVSVFWFETQQGQVILFLLHSIKSGSGPTQPPVAGNWGSVLSGNRNPGRESDHSTPSNAEIKE